MALDQQTPTAGFARPIGPDMAQLWRRFPPRSPAESWPMTEQAREALLGRLLTAPFTVEDGPAARARRRLGLARLLDWLASTLATRGSSGGWSVAPTRWATRSGGVRCWPGRGHATRALGCRPRATCGSARCCSSALT